MSTVGHLPWHRPLATWPGTGRPSHGLTTRVVRFVSAEVPTPHRESHRPGPPATPATLVVKETSRAVEEFTVLSHLAACGVAAAEPVDTVTHRQTTDGAALHDALVTRKLEGVVTHLQALETVGISATLRAFATLLAAVHRAGVFWGDPALSNTLFDVSGSQPGHANLAGNPSVRAYLVDAETARIYAELPASVREYELELAQLNLTGELYSAGLRR